MAVAPIELRWSEEVDIGVVGAGGCGLAAAHAAAHPELKVVIWEKAPTAGGTTALSAGLIAAAGTRMQRAAGLFEMGDDLLNDVRARNGGRSDPALTSQLCGGGAGVVEWLSDGLGLRFDLVGDRGDAGHARARLHAPPSRSGKEITDGLVRLLERRNIRLRLGTPVLHLWTDGAGAVIGARVKVPRKSPTNVRCRKLILATDGFGANRDLVAQHCGAGTALPYVGAVTNNGDALAWATESGAATSHLDAYEGYATVAVGSNLLIPWTLVDSGAILVNQRGERFADETRGSAALVAPVLAQPGHVAYEVLDARILQLVSAHNPRFATEIVPRVVRRANEVEGLAKQFQIDPQALASTVSTYNASVARGDDPFGRRSFGAPLAAPFYGVRVGPALLQTLGGVMIDTHARVVRSDGTAVPNLYAGGGAAVGIAGPGSDGYLQGTGLLCAFGWGKTAGEHAAQELLAGRAVAAAVAPPTEGEPPP